MSYGTLRAGLLALGLGMGLGTMSGCGENPYRGDSGSIPGLPGEDGGLPDTPINRFDHCFPEDRPVHVILTGHGAAWGSPQQTQAEGSSVLRFDRASLSYLGGGMNTGTSNRFTIHANWASAPIEFPGSGAINGRTTARANGDPLTNLGRTGMTGSWAQQFPGFTQGSALGFIWLIEGEILDASTCRTSLRIHGGVRATNGFTGPQDFIAVPLYSPRADGRTGLAEANYSNEGLAVVDDAEGEGLAFTAEFPHGESAAGRVSDIEVVETHAIPGSGLQDLSAQVIVLPSVDHPDSGAGGSDAGGGDSGGGDSGGGGG